MPPALDAEFLAGIRGLRSFTHACDLDALALTVPDPLALVEALVQGGFVNKEEIGRHWAKLVGTAYVDPFSTVITDEAVGLLSHEIASKAKALPLYRLGNALTVVMAHPEDKALVNRLAKIIKLPVSPGFSFPGDIADLIRVHYSTELTVEQTLNRAESHQLFAAGVDLSMGGRQLAQLAEANEIVALLDALIFFALRQRASDIHLEPREGESVVRYRIDGTLQPVVSFPRRLQASLVTRLKILCSLNISESRLPADGRFSIALGTNRLDFRFSSIPTQYGEKAVIRLLGQAGKQAEFSLDRMMISQSVLVPYRRLMQSPAGIFFVTGPTGSGKTTTLYATLNELNQTGVNISTIEDPIELRLDGISQTQVQAAINLGFSTMLRSLLRQDPDIILVGEIRDAETAKIAIEAAMTGHLVLATLHTNSAPDAIVRLMEIGVEPYMIAPAVIGVLGQRLVPRICEHCKESYRPAEEVLRRYFDDEELPAVSFYRGRGCHVCNGTGFKGRIAFHELFAVNRVIRGLIVERANPEEIHREARKAGYRPLRHDGLKKVLLGLTTIEEVEAQTPVDFE